MEMTTKKPIVYLACVNSSRKGKRLNYLFEERQRISKILSFKSTNPLFEVVHKDPVVNTYFFPDFIGKKYYQERVKVLHFSGHAESEHLRIEAGKSEWHIHINELSRVIDLLPNLELVYLNGCATPRLLDMLARRDIPAVMISETQKRDRRSQKLAKTFYKALAKGASIQQALARVQKRYPRFGAYRLKYDFYQDQFKWPFDINTIESGKLPWGLYFLEDHESNLYKPLSMSREEKDKLSMYEGMLKRKRKEPSKSNFFTAAAAAIAVLLGIGLSMYVGSIPIEGLKALLAF
ncbi:MAG: CHAT domain-containing protein [Bacteroidota bacterium]